MKRKKTVKKLKTYVLLSTIFALISIFSFILFTGILLKLNILPTKYLILFFIIIFIVYLILFLFSFKIKNKVIKIISYILSTLISIIFIVGSVYLKNTSNFLNKVQGEDYDSLSFSMIVLKDSKYNGISDLKDKFIGYLDDEYKNDIIENLKNVSFEEFLSTDANSLYDSLINKDISAFVIEDNFYQVLKEEIKEVEEKTKIIYNFEVKIKVKKEEENLASINEPFIVYISGIDQYGKIESVRGRSDVNQLAVINPNTHHILLLNTPRDYYVQLAGTSGTKDKLTHAGMYGVNKSIETLENFYNIDIDYYFKVNFNTVVKLVDTIGGIEVYSDTDLVLFQDKSTHIKVGVNKLNGKQALAYARERFGYLTGDRHRGENQQAVIKAIIDKVTSSKVLIGKYNSILKSLEGSFQTNMPANTITSFLKKQLNEMPNWKIDTYSVTGSDGRDYTYTMGNKTKLYVMIPNEKTVKTAKEKIKSILEEK